MSDHAHKEFPISRRDVLCRGGASVLSAMMASLLGSTRPVRAEAISGSVPELDALAVRVVTDSYQFAVAPSRTAGGGQIQHFRWGMGGGTPPGWGPARGFGRSMHVEW